MMSAQERRYALDFRREETAYVMERWLASQSCSLIGIGSVGKSNLLRHLAKPEVQKHYLGDGLGENFQAIIVDPNMLGALSFGSPQEDAFRAWAGYELMMHRLFLSFYPLKLLSKEDAKRFYDAYDAIQDGTNPLFTYMALRYFEMGVEILLRAGARIVFMFDEFEEMIRLMPVKFFQNMRGLRDSHKSQIAYLTFTRTPLRVAADNFGLPAVDFESFEELFTDSQYFVGPYNELDAARMLADLAVRTGRGMPQEVSRTLIEVTGGYAGLLRSAFSIVDVATATESSGSLEETIAQHLRTKGPIRAECSTLWTSLTQSEQYVLRAVARLAAYDVNPDTEMAVNQLVRKRLLRVDRPNNRLEIHPLVFRLYLLDYRDEV